MCISARSAAARGRTTLTAGGPAHTRLAGKRPVRMLVSVDKPGDAGTEQPVRTPGDLHRDLVTGVGVGAETDAEFLPAGDRVLEGVLLGGERFQAILNGEPVSLVKAVARVEADQLEERA